MEQFYGKFRKKVIKDKKNKKNHTIIYIKPDSDFINYHKKNVDKLVKEGKSQKFIWDKEVDK